MNLLVNRKYNIHFSNVIYARLLHEVDGLIFEKLHI